MIQNGRMGIVSAVMALATITCMSVMPARAAQNQPANATPAEDAGNGEGIRGNAALNIAPQRQLSSRADRATTRQIRRAIQSDRSLSMFAHSVNIITRDGDVTLRGVVRSEAEHQALLAKAAAVTGSAVVDDISVLPYQ